MLELEQDKKVCDNLLNVINTETDFTIKNNYMRKVLKTALQKYSNELERRIAYIKEWDEIIEMSRNMSEGRETDYDHLL